MADVYIDKTDRCVCCGEIIPEGTQYCKNCYAKAERKDKKCLQQKREVLRK